LWWEEENNIKGEHEEKDNNEETNLKGRIRERRIWRKEEEGEKQEKDKEGEKATMKTATSLCITIANMGTFVFKLPFSIKWHISWFATEVIKKYVFTVFLFEVHMLFPYLWSNF
jgi:hypothetical protein